MSVAVTDTSFSDLTLVSRGKVRDVYATSDPDALLFVATDRISAYDVILKNVRFLWLACLIQGLTTIPGLHAVYLHRLCLRP